jgi:hypothetical protein
MHNSNTCDMYMCRLRHINDSVLSSLKMEGILFFYEFYSIIIYLTAIVLDYEIGQKIKNFLGGQFLFHYSVIATHYIKVSSSAPPITSKYFPQHPFRKHGPG